MWAYQELALLAVAMAVSKSIEEWRRSAVQQEEAKASPTTDTDPWGRGLFRSQSDVHLADPDVLWSTSVPVSQKAIESRDRHFG